jgi:glycopeptide antibiotics resistance protein
MGERRTNLVPFSGPFLTSENILNIVIFLPLGIYLGSLFKKWLIGKKLLFVFLLSSLVEGLQYILRIGAFDITDIVSNTLGGIIGLMIFKGLVRAFGRQDKAQRFINMMAAPGTALMILLLVLLKMNMLPVRYQ